MIDLHLHSTFSDGSYSPHDLVKMGKDAGLTAMALTDHDSTEGIPQFMAACEQFGMTGIPGVEISAEAGAGTLHLLGYYLDIEHKPLQAALIEIRDGRERRNERILLKLADLGFPLEWDEVAGLAGEDVVGRPHFAQAMIAHGYVKNKQAAFDKYLGKGQPAYIDRFRLPPPAAINLIKDAGGLAVLAHPFTLKMGVGALKQFVAELVESGLTGIEVFYSEHSPEHIRQYSRLAREYKLVMTGGTDFHGAANPKVRLGVGFGDLMIPDEVVPELQQRVHF